MIHSGFVGLGSNLGSPVDNCRRALDLLSKQASIGIVNRSSFYRTSPVGKTDQDWFVNAVARFETPLSPEEILDLFLNLEIELGRKRREKWGPREIDLDLLFYDDRVSQAGNLILPHPEIERRAFVLIPMNEIAPEWVHPVLKKTIRDLVTTLAEDQMIQRIP
ncbi:MAG: 2-amino-4-hydroxy-6-hydroxymethyldihydropteridine diphosphokinase [Nitrospinae bacterium CG11_big_fil_rev_8_21_14_0_20_56_8]|nr:MAG: 2-amino-4-hydroxy-6-hydroxymethyldihydropteridine diphosphokinase [Nitrospinae bacterium CG11_big_fil_rev_8_21_14_0_20_56_8]